MPIVIANFAGVQPASGAGASLFQKFLKVLNQNAWCNFESFGEFKYTLGLVVYIALIIFFAYFYTSITFNPQEIAMNMKKQGGFGADVSFGGTSMIIIVGVVIETLKQIESQMLVRHYRGFISE